MDSKALFKLAEKLSSLGMTDHLKNGKEAVSISLMIPGRINEKSRQLRKEMLKKEFHTKLGDLLDNNNLEVDFNTISPTAQTIQAKLGIGDIHTFITKLSQRQLEIYPNTKEFLI